MKEHENWLGRGSRLTTKNPPTEVAYLECFKTYSEARKREEQIKGWTRAKKEALIIGEITALAALAESKKTKELKEFQSKTLSLYKGLGK